MVAKELDSGEDVEDEVEVDMDKEEEVANIIPTS